MEIYNESVRDILSTDSTPLRLLEDSEVISSTEHTVMDIFFFRDYQVLSIWTERYYR